jgi:hypothetical protein
MPRKSKKTLEKNEEQQEIEDEMEWQNNHVDAIVKEVLDSRESVKRGRERAALYDIYMDKFLFPLIEYKGIKEDKNDRFYQNRTAGEMLDSIGIYDPDDPRFKGSYPDKTVQELFPEEKPKTRGRPKKSETKTSTKAEAKAEDKPEPKPRGRPKKTSTKAEAKAATNIEDSDEESIDIKIPKDISKTAVFEDDDDDTPFFAKPIEVKQVKKTELQEKMDRYYDSSIMLNGIYYKDGDTYKRYDGTRKNYNHNSKVVYISSSKKVDGVIIKLDYYTKNDYKYDTGAYKKVTIDFSPDDMMLFAPGIDFRYTDTLFDAIFEEKITNESEASDLAFYAGEQERLDQERANKEAKTAETKKAFKAIAEATAKTAIKKTTKKINKLAEEMKEMKTETIEIDDTDDMMKQFEQKAEVLKNMTDIKNAKLHYSKAKKMKIAAEINKHLEEQNLHRFKTTLVKLKSIEPEKYKGKHDLIECKIEALESLETSSKIIRVILTMTFPDGKAMGIMFSYNITLMMKHPKLSSFIERITKRINEIVNNSFVMIK